MAASWAWAGVGTIRFESYDFHQESKRNQILEPKIDPNPLECFILFHYQNHPQISFQDLGEGVQYTRPKSIDVYRFTPRQAVIRNRSSRQKLR